MYALRSAPISPQEQALGIWKPFDALHGVDPRLQNAIRDPGARRAKTTSGAGIEPTAFAPYPELTLATIAEAQRRAHRTGWCDRKADVDERYGRDDSHVRAVHKKLCAWAYKAPLRVRSSSASVLSGLVAAGVRAALDQLDGLTSSVGELGVVARAGYGCAEVVWKDYDLSIPVGSGRSVRVQSEIVGSLEQVYPRNIVFDIVNDRPFLTMGPGHYIEIQEPGLQKFLFQRGPEDGPTRFRGYGWANAPLSYLGGLTLEKFGILIETFGLAVPYLQRNDGEGYLTDPEHDHALAILERLGTGQPEVIPNKYGELKHSPVPTNLAPLHTQMLGFVKTEQSKLITGQTLAVEIGAVGSQAAASVHADGLVDTQCVYATLQAEALRSQVVRWILEVNAERWAAAFSRFVPGGCTPADVIAELPIIEWILSEETTTQRLAVFQGVKGLGYELDEEQVRAELRVLAPMQRGAAPAPTGAPAPQAGQAPTPGLPAPGAASGEAAVSENQPSENSPTEAARLAQEMTEHSVERCPHGNPNRCWICGIERVHSVVPGLDGQPHGWSFAWKPIESADERAAQHSSERSAQLRTVSRRQPNGSRIEAVSVLVRRESDGYQLWGRRRDSGKYTTPGGKLEQNELPAVGAARELVQEAGITAGVQVHPTDQRSLRRAGVVEFPHARVHCFVLIVPDGTSATSANDPDQEVNEWEWLRSIPEVDQLHTNPNAWLVLRGESSEGPGAPGKEIPK